MSKRLLFAALAAAGLLASCSSSEDMLGPDLSQAQKDANAQIINIGVAAANENIDTRTINPSTSRRLRSSVAAQKIEDVKVVIVKLTKKGTPVNNDEFDFQNYTLADGGKIVRTKTFDDWMNSSTKTTTGRQKEWRLDGKATDSQQLDEGMYIAYAAGFVPSEYSETSGFSNLTTNNSLTLPRAVTKSTGGSVREIFVGMSVFKVNEQKQVQANVRLHRQVAGALGYFTKIPVHGDAHHDQMVGKTLRLISTHAANELVFAHFNSDFSEANKNVDYVVNGCAQKADINHPNIDPLSPAYPFYDTNNGTETNKVGHLVYEETIANWFPKGDTNNDGVLDEKDWAFKQKQADGTEVWNTSGWRNNYESEGVTMKKGTILSGEFLIPFSAPTAHNTLQLQLIGETGTGDNKQEQVIRAWNINLASKDAQVDKYATIVASDGTVSTSSTKEATDKFGAMRNHLYSIGVRKADTVTPPTPDPNPDPDGPTPDPTYPDPDDNDPDDNPQDLSKETIVLSVADAWEETHQLTVD